MTDDKFDVMGSVPYEGIEVRLGTGGKYVQIVELGVTLTGEDKVLIEFEKSHHVFQLIHALLKALEEA